MSLASRFQRYWQRMAGRPSGTAEADEPETHVPSSSGGAAANVARLELGASPAGETGTFVEWMATRTKDPDLTADLRMMVPVHYDVGRGLTRVWMFLGWLGDTLDVSFARPPEVRSALGLRASAVFEDATYPIATPVVIESLVSRVLNRDEFRRLCDRCGTPDEVIRAVQ